MLLLYMSSEEKLKLPEPLKIDKNILNQLDDLEKNGITKICKS